MNETDNIISKDTNLNPIIYNILNEAYHEFKQMYGDKHSNHIKEKIESITDKVKESDMYYCGSSASANANMGVIYTISDDLSAVLKHEMWHVYNDSAGDRENSLQYIPQRYMDKLEQNGYLKKIYNEKMEYYKKQFKDEPKRLEILLTNFETFKNNRFDFEDSPVELWTEWFNCQTHLKDMEENFWEWDNGFFTKSFSSGSYYDCFMNIASMISNIIPKEKLLEMYLNTGKYKTDYSYPEMLQDFDNQYSNALDEKEKDIYTYPYMKIILDVKTIDENARKNPALARRTLQDCMKTCFNAYLQKLDNIQNVDVDTAEKLYSEIKNMQEQMVWNIDISKMKDFDYIQSMNKIQDKFKDILQELDMKNPKVNKMMENIDYTADNPFKFIEDGELISKKIVSNQTKDTLINVGGYNVNVGENGVKDNLYLSLNALLGSKKYNLLFEKFQNDNLNDKNENILLKIHQQIQKAKNDDDFINIYNNIYDLYIQKLENTLKINENMEVEFNKYSNQIVELQKNGLFNEKTSQYLPKLEKIINIYNDKQKEYKQEIDKITEKKIQNYLNQGMSLDIAKEFAERIPNMYKNDLNEQKQRIATQKETQILDFKSYNKSSDKQKNCLFNSVQIGRATINVPTEDKINAEKIEQSILKKDDKQK